MSAPSFVPTPTLRPTDVAYRGPRRRLGSWTADRPGEIGEDGQPGGERFGVQGPDQGYALLLARTLVPRLRLAPDEHVDDAVVGCTGVALKRSSLHGRAPVLADLEVAFGLFGFFDDAPPDALAEKRRGLFAGVAHHHHYAAARAIADRVPEDLLRLAPSEAVSQGLPA
ncbi:MAG: hypothetical protein H8E59_02910 [Actinobacteria bacterium]|nr:hypothetical protein [Actinomycetota bacterium]